VVTSASSGISHTYDVHIIKRTYCQFQGQTKTKRAQGCFFWLEHEERERERSERFAHMHGCKHDRKEKIDK
jgi:hypothetical protein